MLSGRDTRVLELGDDLFPAFKVSRLISKRFDSIAFNDAMSNAFIAIFKESLEYDEKCDRVMNLCDVWYGDGRLNLYESNINDDEVKCLKKYVFPVLKDLRELNLRGNLNYLMLDNQITKIDKDTFNRLSKLEWLYLYSNLNDLILDNQITKIDKDSFNSLFNLGLLDLESNLNNLTLDNKISYIEQNAFQNLSKLQFLYLWGNLNIQNVLKDVQRPNPSCDIGY